MTNLIVGGCSGIVKILATLSVNPNAPNEVGITPIFYAAMFGHTEILKILDSFTIYIYLQWGKLIPLEMENY